MATPTKTWHILGALLVTVVVTVIYSRVQPQMRPPGSGNWDGTQYARLYGAMTGAPGATASFPFCRRVAVPYLASRLPMDETRAFLLINLGAGMIAVVFCFLALIQGFSPRVAWFAILPMLFGIFSPIRHPNYYPQLVDAPAMAAYAIAAWLWLRGWRVAAVTALAASCVIKETGLYFALLFSMYAVMAESPRTRRRVVAALAIVDGLAALALAALTARFCATSSVALTVLTHGYIHLRNPWGVLSVVAGASLTVGPFALRWIYPRAGMPAIAAWRNPFFAAGVLAFIMAIVGGSDVSRILFGAYPLFVLYLATHAAFLNGIEWLALAGAGLTANRFLERIPDAIDPAGQLDVKSFFNFVPEHGPISVSLALLAFWAGVYFLVNRLSTSSRA